MLCGHVIHAVDLYEREGRASVVRLLRQGEIQQFQGLGMVRQAGELVLIGRTRRLRFPHRQLPLRALEMEERHGGKARQREGNDCSDRRQDVHRSCHVTGAVPDEKACDAAVAGHHRLHLASRRIRIVCGFDIFHAGDLLGCPYQARISIARLQERRLKHRDGIAQGCVLLERKVFITFPRPPIADAGCEHDRCNRKTHACDDQARHRDHALRGRRGGKLRAGNAPSPCPSRQPAPAIQARCFSIDLVHRDAPSLRYGAGDRVTDWALSVGQQIG